MAFYLTSPIENMIQMGKCSGEIYKCKQQFKKKTKQNLKIRKIKKYEQIN